MSGHQSDEAYLVLFPRQRQGWPIQGTARLFLPCRKTKAAANAHIHTSRLSHQAQTKTPSNCANAVASSAPLTETYTAMNFLKDMYPQVDKELLESVWTVAEGNVFDALELLRSNVGSDTKIKDSTSISEKEVAHSSQVKETMPTSTVDCSGCRSCLVEDGTAVYCQPFIKDEQPKLAMAPSSSPPLRWPSRKKVPVQEEENSPVSALQVYIAVRQLVPNVTFNVFPPRRYCPTISLSPRLTLRRMFAHISMNVHRQDQLISLN